MYRDASLGKYLADGGSGDPTPGGGSVSALAGALAAAMGQMVANFTVGKKRYADVQPEVALLLAELDDAGRVLLELVDGDVEAYGLVSAAYTMPKGDAEQRGARSRAIEAALRGALEVPLQVMRECARVGAAGRRLAQIGNRNLMTDAGVCVILAQAACAAARLNVDVNLKFLDDPDLRQATGAEMDELSSRVETYRREGLQEVGSYLAG